MRQFIQNIGRVRPALHGWQTGLTPPSRRWPAPSSSSSLASPSTSSTSSTPSTPSLSRPFPAASPFHTTRHTSLLCRPLRPAPSHHRHFHLPAALAPIIDAPVSAVESLLVQLHATTGAPWCLAIPLVALGVNLVVRLPFSWHARGLAQTRARLAPLLQAWTVVHSKAVRRQGGADAATEAAATAAVLKRYRPTARRVYRAFGVQQWKLYGNLLALPPWLVVIEALRRLCGAPAGLLGMLFRRAGGGGGGAEGTGVATEGAEAATTQVLSQADPSLAIGGCLWFPDLTVADPYGILPIALSAVLVVNVLPGTDAGRRALFGLEPVPTSSAPTAPRTTTVQSAAARALQRMLLLLSVSVGFVTMHFPSALHLYWLASACSSFLITRGVYWARPMASQALRPTRPRDMPWVMPRATKEKP